MDSHMSKYGLAHRLCGSQPKYVFLPEDEGHQVLKQICKNIYFSIVILYPYLKQCWTFDLHKTLQFSPSTFDTMSHDQDFNKSDVDFM